MTDFELFRRTDFENMSFDELHRYAFQFGFYGREETMLKRLEIIKVGTMEPICNTCNRPCIIGAWVGYGKENINECKFYEEASR